jgi:hypothetical protein
VKRTKSPVLTSPWKIGFLVSLMLVFESIGVSYYFVHQYRVPLNLLERDWLNPSEWLGVIRGQGFLFEVLPLIGLVIITAMISYMSITAAVRKYKRYLDSGLDYKNLLSSLKDVEDLEDKKKIERIKNHPELKRLLLGMAESLEERERLLSEREGGLETRLNDALAEREKELGEEFARECDRLSKAIEARSLDPSAIEFSNPDLARLSKAVRLALQADSAAAPSDVSPSYAGMRETAEMFQSKLLEISEELRLSRETAQGIERQIRAIAPSAVQGSQDGGTERAAKEVKTVLGSIRELEDLAAAIELTAEEARGVAINTALRAGSGEGTQDDLIRLAEDVKEVAGRFKDATKRFFKLAAVMRTSAGTLENYAVTAARHPAGSAIVERDMSTILSRVSLWVERVVVLSDRVANLSESYGVAMTSLSGPPRDAVTTAPETVLDDGATDRGEAFETGAVERAEDATVPDQGGVDSAGEFGFQTLDREGSIFPEESSSEEPAGQVQKGFDENEISGRDEETKPGETEHTTRETGGSEPEREEEPSAGDRLFEEMSTRPLGYAGGDVVEREVVDGTAAREERPEKDEPREPELLRSPLGEKMRPPRVPPTRETDEAEADEDVVDLYSLGAVDYDPALHG